MHRRQSQSARFFIILEIIAVILVLCFLVKPNWFRRIISKNPFVINADTTDIVLPKDSLGVFGLPNDTVAKDLGAGWARKELLWKNYDQNPSTFDQQQENLATTKTLYTIRAVSGTKTNCYIDQVTLNNNRSRLTPEQLANPATFASCSPKDINEYNNFIAGLASKYKDSVQAWQIENEVFGRQANYWSGDKILGEIDNYLSLLSNASREIRKADPAALVLASGIALPNPAEFDDNGYLLPITGNENAKLAATTIENNVSKLLKNNCSDFDIIDLHLYHTIESIPNRVKWLKRLMSESSCIKPIWATEESGPDPDDPAYKNTLTVANLANEVAKDLPRRMRALSDAGVEKIFYLPYKDYPLNRLTENLGLVDNNLNKKPLYTVFQQVSGVKMPSTANSGNTVRPPVNNSNRGFDWGTFIGSIFGLFGGGAKPTPPNPTSPSSPGTPSTDSGQAPSTSSGQANSTGSQGEVTYNPEGVGSYGAAGTVDIVPPGEAANIGQIVATIFRVAIVISAAIFLVMFLFGGLTYLTSAGNEEGTAKGKKIMVNAIIGLIIVLGAYGVGTFILRAIGFKIK